MENKKKVRITYLDIAKGVLILLLVYAHFESAVNRIPYESSMFVATYKLNNFFTCFYMSAFFIISGYCSNFNKPIGAFLLSIGKTLVIPLVAFTLINQAITAIIDKTNFFEQLINHIYKGGGLWFLQAMILAKIIYYGISKLIIRWGGYLIICLAIMTLGVFLNQYGIGNNYLYYRHALVALFWIAMGQLLKEKTFLFEKLQVWSLYAFPLVAIASYFKYVSITASISISLLTIPLHIVYSLTGTMFLLRLCSMVKRNKTLEYWGQNSIVVYVLHFIPLLFLAQYLWELLLPESVLTYVSYILLLYTLEYSLCWLFIKIFNLKPFCFLVGKF